jgi:hypothetical protein
VDTKDKGVAAVDAMADKVAEDDEAEDEVLLHRRRKTTTYPKSAGRLPHYVDRGLVHHVAVRLVSCTLSEE